MSVTVTCPCCGLGEHECKVTPGTPDVMYLRNGDPGYPGDPPECEILSSTCECFEYLRKLSYEMEKEIREKYERKQGKPYMDTLYVRFCIAVEEQAFESLSDYDDDPRGGDGPDD